MHISRFSRSRIIRYLRKQKLAKLKSLLREATLSDFSDKRDFLLDEITKCMTKFKDLSFRDWQAIFYCSLSEKVISQAYNQMIDIAGNDLKKIRGIYDLLYCCRDENKDYLLTFYKYVRKNFSKSEKSFIFEKKSNVNKIKEIIIFLMVNNKHHI